MSLIKTIALDSETNPHGAFSLREHFTTITCMLSKEEKKRTITNGRSNIISRKICLHPFEYTHGFNTLAIPW